MPEHVHIVIWVPNAVKLMEILKSLKGSVSRRALYWVRRNAPESLGTFRHVTDGGVVQYRFWLPGGGFERFLRSDRDVHEKIRYCHNNPVKRGLVERAEDWEWSSYRAYITGLDEPIALDREHIPTIVDFE